MSASSISLIDAQRFNTIPRYMYKTPKTTGGSPVIAVHLVPESCQQTSFQPRILLKGENEKGYSAVFVAYLLSEQVGTRWRVKAAISQSFWVILIFTFRAILPLDCHYLFRSPFGSLDSLRQHTSHSITLFGRRINL